LFSGGLPATLDFLRAVATPLLYLEIEKTIPISGNNPTGEKAACGQLTQPSRRAYDKNLRE
jgi:hypothetical protein